MDQLFGGNFAQVLAAHRCCNANFLCCTTGAGKCDKCNLDNAMVHQFCH